MFGQGKKREDRKGEEKQEFFIVWLMRESGGGQENGVGDSSPGPTNFNPPKLESKVV